MSKKTLTAYSALVVLGCSSLTFTQSAHAFNLGNMMNPSKWFGGNSDRRYRDDSYYDRGSYGYGRGYGPGWGGYGPGWGGYGPGYGGYGPGYGGYGPGYGGYGPGWGGYGYGYPGYAAPQTQQRAPDPVPQ